jgi:hypothetical protein
MGLGTGIRKKLIPDSDSGVKRASYPEFGSTTLLAMYRTVKSPSGRVSNICLAGPLLFNSFEFCLVRKIGQLHSPTCKIAPAY